MSLRIERAPRYYRFEHLYGLGPAAMLPRTVALHFPMAPVRALLAPGHLPLRNASQTTHPPSLIHPICQSGDDNSTQKSNP